MSRSYAARQGAPEEAERIGRNACATGGRPAGLLTTGHGERPAWEKGVGVKASRWLDVALFAALTAYVFLLVFPPAGMPGWARDSVLGTVVYVLPMALLFRRGYERPETQPWTVPLGVGVSFFLCGHLYSSVRAGSDAAGFPSIADISYLSIYPFLLAGVLFALREHLRGMRLIVALDGIAGCAAGGAVATWAVAPLVGKVWDGSWTTALTLAYPVGDVVVVAASLGALGIVGASNGRHFAL